MTKILNDIEPQKVSDLEIKADSTNTLKYRTTRRIFLSIDPFPNGVLYFLNNVFMNKSSPNNTYVVVGALKEQDLAS